MNSVRGQYLAHVILFEGGLQPNHKAAFKTPEPKYGSGRIWALASLFGCVMPLVYPSRFLLALLA